MSDQTKLRIQVAYDAWKLTYEDNICIKQGRYLDAIGLRDEAYLNRLLQVDQAAMPSCRVCALGALLLSFLKSRPREQGPFQLDEGYLSRGPVLNELPFEKSDLDRMELIFEARELKLLTISQEEGDEAIALGKYLRKDRWAEEEIAKALFLNLIENEGVFRLNRKRPCSGLSTTMSDAAEAVLKKYDIKS